MNASIYFFLSKTHKTTLKKCYFKKYRAIIRRVIKNTEILSEGLAFSKLGMEEIIKQNRGGMPTLPSPRGALWSNKNEQDVFNIFTTVLGKVEKDYWESLEISLLFLFNARCSKCCYLLDALRPGSRILDCRNKPTFYFDHDNGLLSISWLKIELSIPYYCKVSMLFQ